MNVEDLEILLPPSSDEPGTALAAVWGTVTQASPLLIQLDCDSTPLPGSPTNLAGLLQVGDRAWCIRDGFTVVVVGVYGPDAVSPPVPAVPTAVAVLNGLLFSWSGLDYLDAEQPVDWRYTELHVSPVADFTPGPGSLAGVYTSRQGGNVAVYDLTAGVEYFAKLVSVDYTNNRSDPSAEVSATAQALTTDPDLAAALASKPGFYTDDAPPPSTGVTLNSLWTKTDLSLWRFDGSDWVLHTWDGGSVLAANSVVTANLAAGAVVAATIDAEALDGFVITGATVRTAASGARVVLDSNGLKGYDAANVVKTTVGTNGKLTAVDGTFSGTVGADGLVVTNATNGTVTIKDGYVRSTAPGLNDTTMTAGYLEANSGGIKSRLTHLQLDFNYAGTSQGHVGQSGSGGLEVVGTTNLFLTGANTFLGTKATTDRFYYLPETTTSAANAFWSSVQGNGYRRLQVSTSLRQYKALIEDLDTDPAAVLKLRPRTWYDKGQVFEAGLDPEVATAEECDAAGLRRIPGFIAEEVQAIDDRFCQFDNDEDNNRFNDVLNGVAYDRISAALLLVVQRQQRQIDTLTARLDELA